MKGEKEWRRGRERRREKERVREGQRSAHLIWH
jgi:hypothetical protein